MKLNPRTLKIAGIAVGVVIVILVALPVIVDIDNFRPKIESAATDALGRPVTLGKLSLSIVRRTVSIDEISIGDDSAFSKSPFVTAKHLAVSINLMPLIFSKELSVRGIVLDEPQITLLKAANGTWNFSSLGATSKQRPDIPGKAERVGEPPSLSVGKLEISNGKLAVGKANSATKPQTYDQLNVEVSEFSAATEFPFEVTVQLPESGEADLSGKAGPINPQDVAKTPVDATVKVKNMDLAASGFVDPSVGLGSSADFEGTINSNGSQGKASGELKCEKLKLSPKGKPASEDVTVKYLINADLDQQVGTITQADIAVGKAMAKLTGGFRGQGDSTAVNMKLSAPNMPVDELTPMLPALGIVLPSGSELEGGALSVDLSITGTLDKLVIAGPVRLSNTKLAGFDVGSKLGALSAFGGRAHSSPDTTIQNASLTARIAPEMTRADAINVMVSSLGTVTGAGTVSPAGALDFRMTADLQGQMSERRSERTGRTERGAVSFMIQGTTSDPKFIPDVSGVAGNALQTVAARKVGGKRTSNSGGGLFRRK